SGGDPAPPRRSIAIQQGRARRERLRQQREGHSENSRSGGKSCRRVFGRTREQRHLHLHAQASGTSIREVPREVPSRSGRRTAGPPDAQEKPSRRSRRGLHWACPRRSTFSTDGGARCQKRCEPWP